MEKNKTGLIRKGIGGFYYVEAADILYECRARGIFRKDGVSPLPGDRVLFSSAEDGTGEIEEILPRRNFLFRPPVANVDRLVVVASVCDPEPNTLLIDKMIAYAERRGIEPTLVISKVDLLRADRLTEAYGTSGIPLFCVSSPSGEGVDGVRELLRGKTTVFAGNTGVGKSSLLNGMFGELHQQTGEISRKLGRGRHTTRQVELLKLASGGYAVDTPGFSSIGGQKGEWIPPEELAGCFREFGPYLGRCRFTTCSHTCEKGCAVLQAVEDGAVSKSRHESYVAMYREMKGIKEWETK